MRKLFSITVFAFTVMAVQNASAQTAGLQNSTRGAARANVSNVQRALESRSGLLERANARARGQSHIRADVTTRNGMEARANANANARINANASGRENSPAAGRSLLPTEAAGRLRLPRGLVRQRMEIENSANLRGRSRASLEVSGRADLETRERRNAKGHNSRVSNRANQILNRRRPEVLQMRAEVRNQARARADVSLAERQLTRRLAQIDKMRDIALENGNETQLKQADRLEQLARWQFENEGSARAANQTRIFTDSESMEESERTLHPFRSNRRTELGIDQSLETGIEAETPAETEVQAEVESTTTGTIDP